LSRSGSRPFSDAPSNTPVRGAGACGLPDEPADERTLPPALRRCATIPAADPIRALLPDALQRGDCANVGHCRRDPAAGCGSGARRLQPRRSSKSPGATSLIRFLAFGIVVLIGISGLTSGLSTSSSFAARSTGTSRTESNGQAGSPVDPWVD
jgi:hypothetical protein